MKRNKKLVYFLCKRVLFIAIGISVFVISPFKRLFIFLRQRNRPAGRAVILMYHYIKKRDVSSFKRHTKIFSRYNNCPSSEALNKPPENENKLFITFDDGFVSVLENALPILQKKNIPAAVFIPTGYIGKKPDWFGNPLYQLQDEIVMNEKQIRELSKSCEIGSHGVSHTDLCEMSTEKRRRELLESKALLEKICNKEVTSISFPFGKYDKELLDLAKELGYRHFFTIEPSLVQIGNGQQVYGRFEAFPFDTALEVILKCSGAYFWLAYAIDLKRAVKQKSHFISSAKK